MLDIVYILDENLNVICFSQSYKHKAERKWPTGSVAFKEHRIT